MIITVFHNAGLNQFFFSTDHCQGVRTNHANWPGKPEDWVPMTGRLPMRVVPRAGLLDGLINTLGLYKAVFHNGETEIPNPDKAYRPTYREPAVAACGCVPRRGRHCCEHDIAWHDSLKRVYDDPLG